MWRKDAACNNMSPELFFDKSESDTESPYPSKDVQRLCAICKVRGECLMFAMHNDEYGVWGGTSKYQRDQLKRRRARMCCPGCGGQSIVEEGGHQLCLGCGISWTCTKRWK